MTTHMTIVIFACLMLPPTETSVEDGPGLDLARLAGDYYKGDGLGQNRSLTITKTGRFSFVWRPDMGVRQPNEGTAQVDGRRLILRPDRPDPARLIAGTDPPAFIPVRWGKRVYLISENELLDFCNAANLGIEPRSDRHGRFYVRVLWDGESLSGRQPPALEPADGRPEAPPSWRAYLLSKPIEGRITDVEAGKGASVDLGSRHGVRPGMILWTEGTGANNLVVVKSVEAASCRVEVRDVVPDRDPVKGRVVRSRIPKDRLQSDAP